MMSIDRHSLPHAPVDQQTDGLMSAKPPQWHPSGISAWNVGNLTLHEREKTEKSNVSRGDLQ